MVIGTQQKNRRHLPRCLLQKIIHSDFLRRHYPHQVKGSKFGHFLSACFTSSPVFDCDCILHPLRTNCKRGQRRAQRCKTVFTQFLGRFTQVLLKKKVKYGIFKADAYPLPVSKKEEFHMKQTTLTQRLLSAIVALCMVLSVCAPAFADVTDPDGQGRTVVHRAGHHGCQGRPLRARRLDPEVQGDRSVEQGVPRSLMPAVWMPCSVRTFSVKMGLLQNSSLKKS